jgi:O-antigen/teichoic acid export membrane protein
MTSSLKEKVVSGTSWKLIEKGVNEIALFLIGIVLARLLSPSDYGVVGLLAVFFAVARTFQDSGFASALIQKRDRNQKDYCTVFYFNIMISLLIYALLFFSAPYIAFFYKVPILVNITRVLALSFIIGGFTGVLYTKLKAEMRFKALSLISIFGTIITGVTGVILALLGYGVWALVFQVLVGELLKGIAIWLVSRWKPSLIFSFESFKRLFSFGGNLLVSGIINTIYNNIYTLVIGKVYQPVQVGYYNRANGYASIPTNIILQLAVDVSYPILATIQDDDERLLTAYQKLLRTPLFLLYPLLTMLIVMASPLIELMIGSKWLPCVPMLQILCLAGFFIPLTHINLNLLYVKGRADLVLRLEFIKKPIAFLILFGCIPFGIYWLIAGRVFYSLIGFIINCYYTKRILNYGFEKQMKVLLPVFINVAIMGCLVHLSLGWTDNIFFKIIIGFLVGVISFLSFSILTKDESLYDVKEIVLNKLNTLFHNLE